ncbi:MAG: ABC transporter permease, partial [Anaerolineales bacterium]
TFMDDPENSIFITQVSQVASVLNLLGVVAMVVSAFLVTNVINTIVLEQKRQIGVMKSMGATAWDTFVIYAGMALTYGIIGTLFGVLLGVVAGYLMAESFASLALTYIEGFSVSAQGIIVGVLMGLLVPVLAALVPVFNGLRVTILDAMTDLGISSDWGHTRVSRFIGGLPLPMTMVQAFSNIWQKKGRLMLTGLTLTLAVAAFMGVTAVFSALNQEIENVFGTLDYDIAIAPQTRQSFANLESVLQSVDGIAVAEPAYALTVSLEGYESNNQLAPGTSQIQASGIETDSTILDLNLLEGTAWQDNPNRPGVVISEVVADNIDKGVGDVVILDIAGATHEIEIIGVDNFPFELLLMDWHTLASLTNFVDDGGDPLPGAAFIVLEGDPDVPAIDDKIAEIETAFIDAGIPVNLSNQQAIIENQVQQFTVFGLIFNITSAIMAAVGAIGLLAALSMAVYERQKEIGVMRSIGASSSIIISQFLIEGLLVGALAWVVALPLALLLGVGLSDALPFGDFFEFSFPVWLAGAGLVGVLLVAALASFWPALAASRRTVSDILRYQ